MNIYRQPRCAAVLAVVLCVACSVLYEVARADENHPTPTRNLDSTSQTSGLKPTVTISLPDGDPNLSLTNSPNLRLSGQMDSLGRFQLLGTNANWQGSYFFVQTSTNLVNWVQIGSIYPWSTNVAGSGFVFTDTIPVGFSRRYYRVVDNLLIVSTVP